MEKIKSIGEFGLINRFSEIFLRNLPEGIIGIGDDCAVVQINKDQSILFTTDMLIEDRHFLYNKISAYELGYKSLAVNLSDIAAMGGTPAYALLSIGIPEKVNVEWLDNFFLGLSTLCSETNTHLLGGDTTQSPDKIVINVTLVGYAKPDLIKLRSKAKVGDLICVTGSLGDSAAGLKLILEDKEIDENDRLLIQRHHLPKPHIEEGKILAAAASVGAMMDVSDGIGSDIRHIMKQSGVGAVIDIDKLPLSDSLLKTVEKYQWDAIDIALNGGEDYCLLFTIREDDFENLNKIFLHETGHEFYVIGKIVSATEDLRIEKNGNLHPVALKGFDHFK